MNWKTQNAVECFFDKGYAAKYPAPSTSSAASTSETEIKNLFRSYVPAGDKMEGDAIEKFFTDLKINVEDPVTLLISYKMKATQ